jgi:hypothetical protein
VPISVHGDSEYSLDRPEAIGLLYVPKDLQLCWQCVGVDLSEGLGSV